MDQTVQRDTQEAEVVRILLLADFLSVVAHLSYSLSDDIPSSLANTVREAKLPQPSQCLWFGLRIKLM